MVRRFALALLAGFMASSASGQLSYAAPNTLYSQNFNSLSNAAPVTAGIAWANNSTLAGWSLFRQPAATPVALTTYGSSDGSSNAGSFFSFGTGTSTERAFGATGSGGAYFNSAGNGAVAGWAAVAFTNNTAFTLRQVAFNYDVEQWRTGGNPTAQLMTVQYGFGATFQTVATWITPGPAFDFTTPTNGGGATALDGNLAANRSAGLGGAIGGLNWTAGQSLWVRFQFLNQQGNDHSFAVDNFTFIAGVPEPGSIGLMAAAGLVAALRLRRRKAAG